MAAGVLVAAAFGLAASVRAQQTLFNVPSADVLAAGKTYLEGDDLWRPSRGEETFFTLRAVVGLGGGLEGGVNVGGLVPEGRSVPTATLAIKWQAWREKDWAVTIGLHGLVFLRGAADGTPSAHAYAHAAWTPALGTRLTAGVWYSTSGYVEDAVTRGALAGFEQRLGPDLVFQADWYSGRNAIGYLTPGFALTRGQWEIYAGYSIKNRESHANAALIEIGRFL